jgi:hypothetical protein
MITHCDSFSIFLLNVIQESNLNSQKFVDLLFTHIPSHQESAIEFLVKKYNFLGMCFWNFGIKFQNRTENPFNAQFKAPSSKSYVFKT